MTLTTIVRATRSSAAHLATAQRHTHAANDVRASIAAAERNLVAIDRARNVSLARLVRQGLPAKRAELRRLDTLATRAMARHEAARAIACSW